MQLNFTHRFSNIDGVSVQVKDAMQNQNKEAANEIFECKEQR
jgi:hypothetical protein